MPRIALALFLLTIGAGAAVAAPSNEPPKNPRAQPAASSADIPAYPSAVPERASSVGGGAELARDVSSWTTKDPWKTVADFYRQRVKGRATEAHEGGLDWLVIAGDGLDATSVQVIRDPGADLTRVVVFRKSSVK